MNPSSEPTQSKMTYQSKLGFQSNLGYQSTSIGKSYLRTPDTTLKW